METQSLRFTQAWGQTAFRDLLKRHEPDLRRAARRLCFGDEDRAQDLAQDTLVRAYEACLNGRFREGGDGRAWLLRILTNLSINEHHRRKRRASVDLGLLTSEGEAGPVETHARAGDVPGVSLMAGTLEEELERALAALPDGLRRCVVLVDLEGLEYGEAARALGVPVGTVRSRLSRARFSLHGLLVDYAQDRRLVRHGADGTSGCGCLCKRRLV